MDNKAQLEFARVAATAVGSVVVSQTVDPFTAALVPPVLYLAFGRIATVTPRAQRRWLRDKTRRDLASPLDDARSVARSVERLRQARVLDRDLERALRDAPDVRSIWSVRPDAAADASGLPATVRVSCATVNVGPLATFIGLEALLAKHGVELEVDHSTANSRDQVRQLTSTRAPEFAVVADVSFAMCPQRVPYRNVMPLHSVELTMFERPSAGRTRIGRLFVYAESSAELLVRSGRARTGGREIVRFDSSAALPGIIEDLGGGDVLIAWDPLVRRLRTDRRLREVQGVSIPYSVSLYARQDVSPVAVLGMSRLVAHAWGVAQREKDAASAELLRTPGLFDRFLIGGALHRAAS